MPRSARGNDLYDKLAEKKPVKRAKVAPTKAAAKKLTAAPAKAAAYIVKAAAPAKAAAP